MSLCVLVPVIWEKTANDCLGSMLAPGSSAGFSPDEVLVVDNTRDGYQPPAGVRRHRDRNGHNLGVAGSWNVGIREVLDRKLDWLVIVSTSLVFGPELHTTFRSEIERHEGEQIVEAMGTSWHGIVLSRWILEAVGLYDTNLYPSYEESIDWGYRQKVLGYEEKGWPRVWFNALNIGHAVHIDRTKWDAPVCNGQALLDYYAAKWGGPKGSEQWVHPFNDPDKPLDWFEEVPIPELARRYGLGRKGVGWW